MLVAFPDTSLTPLGYSVPYYSIAGTCLSKIIVLAASFGLFWIAQLVLKVLFAVAPLGAATQADCYVPGPTDSTRKPLSHFFFLFEIIDRGCQSFRSTYINMARQLTSAYQDVEVYAVSCVPHDDLCRKYSIRGYPVRIIHGSEDFVISTTSLISISLLLIVDSLSSHFLLGLMRVSTFKNLARPTRCRRLPRR